MATEIYCDGAVEPNPGKGGWGVAMFVDRTEVQTRTGGELDTTNNRMEMTGLIEALKLAPRDAACTIYTDSMYCVQGANVWRHAWAKKGWKRKDKKAGPQPVKNEDLWRSIAVLMDGRPQAKIAWVRGHNGNPGNERADELAQIGRFNTMQAAA